jgi:TRAP-type uncharacterized transport system substrate-binding protein|tara:strand:+ start:33 stop:275 length:243 start_codon:yes stop_codon:yes gene_type:complete
MSTEAQNIDYFDNKSEAEKLRNVASLVNDIVNAKTEEPTEVAETAEVNPIVDLVGKTISTHKPSKGAFFQGVQSDGNPKL